MVLNLASILVALAIAGLLSGCSSSPPTPTLAPVTPLSGEERDEVLPLAASNGGSAAGTIPRPCWVPETGNGH